MAQPDFILDSDGDLLITMLEQPGDFAYWREAQLEESRSGESKPVEPKSPTKEPLDDQGNDVKRIETEESEIKTRQLKVSSKHLALACNRVQRMMKNPWRESQEIHGDGLRHWEIEVVDLEAFTIVMDIIHHRNRRVPKRVSLDMLAKIAVVVDDLQCYEAVENFSDSWIKKLRKCYLPSYACHRDTVLWIFITQTFHIVSIFREATLAAITKCADEFETLGLPIRDRMAREINKRREETIYHLFKLVHDFTDRLRGGHSSCSSACESILLGSLMKQLPATYLKPSPSSPYASVAINQFGEAIEALQTPRWFSEAKCATSSQSSNTSNDSSSSSSQLFKGRSGVHDINLEEHTCGFNTLITQANLAIGEISGIHLEQDVGCARDGVGKKLHPTTM
ncbi:hypothetical protein F5Y19DRAFT_253097 [Xylariaceae sp. FL1651]|nr:hypothetical protein F5Y19DRAFT_253097 [Xylariaceae sp. FL1651]